MVFAALYSIALTCDMCGGQGKVPNTTAKWIQWGKLLKARRLASRMSLRAAARLHGIDPSNLSKMERGCICPRPLEYPQNGAAQPPEGQRR